MLSWHINNPVSPLRGTSLWSRARLGPCRFGVLPCSNAMTDVETTRMFTDMKVGDCSCLWLFLVRRPAPCMSEAQCHFQTYEMAEIAKALTTPVSIAILIQRCLLRACCNSIWPSVSRFLGVRAWSLPGCAPACVCTKHGKLKVPTKPLRTCPKACLLAQSNTFQAPHTMHASAIVSSTQDFSSTTPYHGFDFDPKLPGIVLCWNSPNYLINASMLPNTKAKYLQNDGGTVQIC